MAIPKHRVISWLAMHGRLKTADILAQIGLVADASYKFCSVHTESHEHLFFQRDYVKQILSYVYDWLGLKCT